MIINDLKNINNSHENAPHSFEERLLSAQNMPKNLSAASQLPIIKVTAVTTRNPDINSPSSDRLSPVSARRHSLSDILPGGDFQPVPPPDLSPPYHTFAFVQQSRRPSLDIPTTLQLPPEPANRGYEGAPLPNLAQRPLRQAPDGLPPYSEHDPVLRRNDESEDGFDGFRPILNALNVPYQTGRFQESANAQPHDFKTEGGSHKFPE